MKKQLQGIALVLFGILLAIVGVASQLFSTGVNQMGWCFVGGLCGIAGLILVFIKEKQ